LWPDVLAFARRWRTENPADAKALGKMEIVRDVCDKLAAIAAEKFRRAG
jgi:hypothetical protein